MNQNASRLNNEHYELAGVVVCSTVVLTAAFFGIVALVTGVTGLTGRLPYYVLGGAAAFVASVVRFDHHSQAGVPVLYTASGIALVAFTGLGLATEGIRLAITRPEVVVASQLFVYVVAAGLIATGLGFWAVRHWREVASTAGAPGSSGL